MHILLVTLIIFSLSEASADQGSEPAPKKECLRRMTLEAEFPDAFLGTLGFSKEKFAETSDGRTIVTGRGEDFFNGYIRETAALMPQLVAALHIKVEGNAVEFPSTEELNRLLQDPKIHPLTSGFQLVDVVSADEISFEIYAESMRRGKIPIGSRSALRVHDLSVHLIGMGFFPKSLIRIFQRRLNLFNELLTNSDFNSLRPILFEMVKEEVRMWDAQTFNFQAYLIGEDRIPIDTKTRDLHIFFKTESVLGFGNLNVWNPRKLTNAQLKALNFILSKYTQEEVTIDDKTVERAFKKQRKEMRRAFIPLWPRLFRRRA